MTTGGGTMGGLWAAANRCAGTLCYCLNLVHELNTTLLQYEQGSDYLVQNLVYGVCMDNFTAILYIAWMHVDSSDGISTFSLRPIQVLGLHHKEMLQKFYQQVRTILDWGSTTRLEQIKAALDFLSTGVSL
jgi:hypothetical protein